jgi:hypothetical protein
MVKIWRSVSSPGRSLLLAAVLVLLLAGVALAATSAFEIPRSVTGGGGGHSAGVDYAVTGTIGQAVVDRSSSVNCELCSGFWCGLGRYKVYLPLVLRN